MEFAIDGTPPGSYPDIQDVRIGGVVIDETYQER